MEKELLKIQTAHQCVHGGGSVMAWACMAVNGTGSLLFIDIIDDFETKSEGKMNQEQAGGEWLYHSIRLCVVPFLQTRADFSSAVCRKERERKQRWSQREVKHADGESASTSVGCKTWTDEATPICP